ncbi:MAG: CRISPR-associated CARF protein Csx1 [Turneriella sp.]|nr:CRISPR-associated CARF protein Csx1 [Turneriella sp.]
MSADETKLIIIPIGKYADYQTAHYFCENGARNAKKGIHAKCTAGLYAELYQNAHFVFILQDTLVRPKDANRNYKKLCQAVEKDFCAWLRQPETGIPLDPKKYSIIVVPGKGTFPAVNPDEKSAILLHAKNSQANQHAWLTWQLIQILRNFLRDGKISVILDTSHGVNNLPLTVAAVLEEILPIYAYHQGDVQFEILNSDPYWKTELPKLEINTIEKKIIYPDLPFRNYNRNDLNQGIRLKVLDSKDKELARELNQKCRATLSNEVVQKLQALLAALRHGFPLAAAWLVSELASKSLKDPLGPLFQQIRENTTIARDGNTLEIKAWAVLPNTIAADIARICFLLEVLRNLFGDYSQENGISIEVLLSASKKIYTKNQIELKLIQHELEYDLPKLMKQSARVAGWQLLASLRRSEPKLEGPVEKERTRDASHRNFYAHAGLEQNITEVLYKNREIRLRYAKGTQDTVLNHLRRLLTSERN